MKIHKAGIIPIVVAFFLLTALSLAVFFLIDIPWLSSMFYAAFAFFFLFVCAFFRFPHREIPELQEGEVLCPADGKIVVIEETLEKEYFKDQRKQISIFMSVTNVHINWYPLEGIIAYVKYHAGQYLVAWHPKSSELNERNTVVVEGNKGAILMRQIAGYVARKIVSTAQQNDQVKRGDRIGMIKFGSRVDLFLPLDAEVKVQIGQKVKGGKTILATLK